MTLLLARLAKWLGRLLAIPQAHYLTKVMFQPIWRSQKSWFFIDRM
jgi:hypothetical protein